MRLRVPHPLVVEAYKASSLTRAAGDRWKVDVIVHTGIVEVKRTSKKDDFWSVHPWYSHQPCDIVKSRSDTYRWRQFTVPRFVTAGMVWCHTCWQTCRTLAVKTYNTSQLGYQPQTHCMSCWVLLYITSHSVNTCAFCIPQVTALYRCFYYYYYYYYYY